ncbi:MAG: ClpXP protease specificity-enhancing factor [Legionella sp.]|nr:MAG: ClpXP protease specificity-enhancing factor [Legionella sp.]PJD97779.1 MAG: ClpXP protease specificity-enhancing factor [Legionella sp.]
MMMTSNKPYLIRAFYDWIVDNQLTPYMLVNATYPNAQVPKEHIQHDRIVLNISPTATRGLLLENDRIVFTARFSGQAQQVVFSPNAVLEIYAKENGRGIAFPDEEEPLPPVTPASDAASTAKNKPSLKLVK